jgi:bifunctional non-homologous end joining protein LigD
MARTDVLALVARHALRPMLATAADLPAGDQGWAYEMKWDGARAIAYASAGEVRLVSRTGRDITGVYPELGRLPGALAGRQAVLDGEIVAYGGGEWPSFEALQQRMNVSSPAQARVLASRDPVSFLAFDLLVLDGEELVGLPYSRRRELLEGIGLTGGFWQVPPSVLGESGADLLAVARQHGLEGVVAKRLDSRYEPGRRSVAWLKHKILRRQEVVVGGWKPGEGRRAGGIGSLLIGVQGPRGLEYAGHVGTGFTDHALDGLFRRLAPLRRPTSPFASKVPPEYARAARWVQPRLVVEVEFARWTSAGRMRAPSYKGLRDDRDPAEVVREPGPWDDADAGC